VDFTTLLNQANTAPSHNANYCTDPLKARHF
jgi:hypothetical protein